MLQPPRPTAPARHERLTHVLYTVDTELSLMMQARGRPAEDNYQSAIMGRTTAGDFGLVHQLDALDRHGLKGVFFVEALHAVVLGSDYLKRIVEAVVARGHEAQLHCHCEWLWFHPGALRTERAQRILAHFSYDRQVEILGMAKAALEGAGAPPPTAFRAGGYGANDDTLRALATLGLTYDSSFNRTVAQSTIGIAPTTIAPVLHAGMVEIPIAWFFERGARVRHLQLAAASADELRFALGQAAAARHPAVAIVSHSFELLNRTRERAMPPLVRRFEALCQTLARDGKLRTVGFNDVEPADWLDGGDPLPIRSNQLRTVGRLFEQGMGRLLYDRRKP